MHAIRFLLQFAYVIMIMLRNVWRLFSFALRFVRECRVLCFLYQKQKATAVENTSIELGLYSYDFIVFIDLIQFDIHCTRIIIEWRC